MNKLYLLVTIFITVFFINVFPKQIPLSNSKNNSSEINLSTPPPHIKVQDPDGGEIWYAGTSNTIKWDDNINENVVIELYKGGSFYSTIFNSTPSDKTEIWDIPLSIESGSDYKVKISSVLYPNIFDFSHHNFTILRNQITVTTPNGGESWQAGTTQIISWSDNIAENVSIELYKGGTLHSTISSSTSSDGSMDWSIPEAMESGSDYRIKITNINEPSITDTSDAEFTIIGKPEVHR